MFRFLRWLFSLESTQPTNTKNSSSSSAMNEGDFHSGPAGYSPNTPYVETQYGSGFDEEADWADRADRQAIAQRYGLEEPVFDSLLEHLETIRNFCAHHSRLWNRHVTKGPKIPKKLAAPLTANFNLHPQALPNVYNTIILLDYIDYFVSGEQKLFESVRKLLDSYPEIDPNQMGFPKGF